MLAVADLGPPLLKIDLPVSGCLLQQPTGLSWDMIGLQLTPDQCASVYPHLYGLQKLREPGNVEDNLHKAQASYDTPQAKNALDLCSSRYFSLV